MLSWHRIRAFSWGATTPRRVDRTSRSARRSGSSRLTALLGAAALLGVVVPALAVSSCSKVDSDFAAALARAVDPSHVSFTLEGCRNDGSITFGDTGPFICPDAAYTTGNLGKGWNELDLVPHRLTAQAGKSAPSSQTYVVAVALDAWDVGYPGYDLLSAPALNAGLSDSSCAEPTVGGEVILTPGLGGIDQTRYRLLVISQDAETTCVYDFYGRLAVGSHLFPGSSLHANAALPDDGGLTTAGIGARDVSIPVKEILPQELRKDMAASQDSDHIWSLTKSPAPATLNFADTCDPSPSARQAGVTLTITWARLPAVQGGAITVLTHIYAKNPAHRTITVDVSDAIYSGTTLIDDSFSSGPVDVPANTEALVGTNTVVVPEGTTDLNDLAAATYTDKATGIPVPGQTTATASALVQASGTVTNQTATIDDLEGITGDKLSYSGDSFTPAVGAWVSYTPGTITKGSVEWLSSSQSGGGSVALSKTVYVDEPAITSGTLADTATLTGSDGFTASAPASVSISADAKVALTIDKTVPPVLQAPDVFYFAVKDSGDNVVASPSISFAAGETSNSTTVTGLAPGTYTVSETGSASGDWPLPGDQSVAITLPSCAETVTFVNTFGPASAQAQKVTLPAGEEAGWTFILTGPNTPAGGEQVTTTGAGAVAFTTELIEGTYTITEVPQPGWEEVSASAECSFTVDYPADADRLFSCTYTNRWVPTGKITPTDTTCSMYLAGTAYDLTDVWYRTKSGYINNSAPGVFFYYSQITAPSAGFTIDVVQSSSNASVPFFDPQNLSNIRLYNADCSTADGALMSIPSDGQARLAVSGATPGASYIVSVKYITGSVVGTAKPSPSTVHYDFATRVNMSVVDSDADGVNLMYKGGD
jgi:hypothetical protein